MTRQVVSPRTASILAVLLLACMLLAWSSWSRGEAQQQSSTAIPPERVRVGLVLIEVVVRDRKDQVITGLGREQFVLHVDGRRVPQDEVPVFEETCTDQPSTAAAPAHPPEGTNDSAVVEPLVSTGLVLYFDVTQLSFAALSNTLALARAYFEGPYDGTTEVEILANASTGFQEFTTDRVKLASAVRRMQKIRDLRDVLEEDYQYSKVLEVAHTPNCLNVARPYAFAEWERARLSLEELKQIVEDLKGKKDRLKLVLMSDALRLEPGEQYLVLCDTTSAALGINLSKQVDDLVAAAERAGISIYTVHARGLVDSSEGLNQVGIDSAHGLQATLALQTGGRALRNSNDVPAIVESAGRDLRCYYLLGYAPTNPPDGRRHTIGVTVEKSPSRKLPVFVNVRHRPFFIDRIP